jgi:hypothetical protein
MITTVIEKSDYGHNYRHYADEYEAMNIAGDIALF